MKSDNHLAKSQTGLSWLDVWWLVFYMYFNNGYLWNKPLFFRNLFNCSPSHNLHVFFFRIIGNKHCFSCNYCHWWVFATLSLEDCRIVFSRINKLFCDFIHVWFTRYNIFISENLTPCRTCYSICTMDGKWIKPSWQKKTEWWWSGLDTTGIHPAWWWMKPCTSVQRRWKILPLFI